MGELPDVARRSVLFAPFFRAKRNWLTHFVSMVFIYTYIYTHSYVVSMQNRNDYVPGQAGGGS